MSESILLISVVHFMDWAEASTPSKSRIGRMLNAMPRVAYLFPDSNGEFRLSREDGESLFVTHAKAMEALASFRRNARPLIEKPRNPGADWTKLPRETRDHFLELARPLMETQLAAVGLTFDEAKRRLTQPASVSLKNGNIIEYVQMRRRDDKARNGQVSDTGDELHLSFSSFSDVFTVDKNVFHYMKHKVNRIATSNSVPKYGNATHVYPTGGLFDVMQHVRSLVDGSRYQSAAGPG